MQRYITSSAAETEALAERLAGQLRGGEVIAFVGGMGMGKTCFTHGLAAGLGIDPGEVSSPTFALVNEYRGGRLPLFHFDMYRVESFDALYSTGFFDYLDQGGVVAVEWSENIAGALPEECIRITFVRLDETSRAITIEGVTLP
ncbi:MAG: tRNA (adenosine(37)-N6)-threonylcarbamoyltransferase complex ATPase subunit type 1 TsaE [Clostridiales bacterium]|nr:tRNA (adenosine(37)-N6)-threonylcarbamoyltransferase complex ATPase subunit type 1 TsaE [Clostridiales bacterium]